MSSYKRKSSAAENESKKKNPLYQGPRLLYLLIAIAPKTLKIKRKSKKNNITAMKKM